MNQVPVDGRNTAVSALPSPSKSATAGISPFAPKGSEKYELSSLLKTNQVPVEGRKNAMSVLPSPVKSAGVGMSVLFPKGPAATVPSELRWYHHSEAAFGRKIDR